MPSRSGVDAQQGLQVIVEFKSLPRGSSTVSPLWLTGFLPVRAHWLHVVPLVCLLVLGAWVPGFLLTLAILLFSLVVALGAFVILVQVPVGYLVHRWRDLRHGGDARRRTPRGAPSRGL